LDGAEEQAAPNKTDKNRIIIELGVRREEGGVRKEELGVGRGLDRFIFCLD
jgi:hypothetical protein